VLPARLVVLEIEFTDRPADDRRCWLHSSPARVDLCRRDTGAPVDIWPAGATGPITRWWLGTAGTNVRIGTDVPPIFGDFTRGGQPGSRPGRRRM
jgi:hypothetical protein